MAIDLKDKDHKGIDHFLNFVLDAHKSGQVPTSKAVYLIAHVIAAAAQDNESEVKAWADDDQLKTWLKKGNA